MDVEVSHKPSGGSQAGPPAPTGGIVVVLALPRELGTGRSVTRAIAHVQKALEGTEDNLAVRRPCEGDVRLFDEIEERIVPRVHLDDAPASGKTPWRRQGPLASHARSGGDSAQRRHA